MKNKKRKVIVFDGKYWYVRRLKSIEHDLDNDEKVYRCDKHISGPHVNLKDVPEVANEL